MQTGVTPLPNVDVAIIGAGFAGISAARTLQRGGATVVVLEAQTEVGGRVRSTRAEDGRIYELGGQFFSRKMARLLDLIEETGLSICDVVQGEASLSVSRGRVLRYQTEGSLTSDFWDRLKAAQPDAFVSMDAWLISQNLEPDVLALQRSGVEELWCRDPADLSLASIQTSLPFGHDPSENDLELYCAEGLGTLATILARELGPSLHLNTPVSSVDRDAEGFLLTTRVGSVRAERLIFAASPVVLNNIEWKSPEDRWLSGFHSQFAPGQMRKIVLRYDLPFWRERGLDCIVQFDDPTGVSAIDASPGSGEAALLVVFAGGRTAAGWSAKDDSEVIERVFDLLEPVIGDAVRHPLTVINTDWTDHPWVGGGYNAAVRPWTGDDPLSRMSKNHRGLFFAVAEIAPRYRGYIEGAIQSGISTAETILKAATLNPVTPVADQLHGKKARADRGDGLAWNLSNAFNQPL